MGQSAESFLRRAAHCERLAEEMGNPQLAEAFHRLAQRWCLAAEHIAKIEKRNLSAELTSPWGVFSLSALSRSLHKTRRHKRTALVSAFALRPGPLDPLECVPLNFGSMQL